jgi:hypothetical protein
MTTTTAAGPVRSLAAALMAIALVLFAPAAVRADALSEGVGAMPAEVEDVRMAGTWTEGDVSGVYRVVIARTGGATIAARLFVQWLVYDDNGLLSVEESLEITALGELGIDIVDYTADLEEDGLSMFIDTIGGDGGDQLYELFVTSRTEYRFGPASN